MSRWSAAVPLDVNPMSHPKGKTSMPRLIDFTAKLPMKAPVTIERLVNLVDPSNNILLNMTADEAVQRVQSGDAGQVGEIDGQFAIVAKEGKSVFLARSIGRPMRYFLAKRAAGPCLIVAERIDQLRDALEAEGLGDQFHPSYSRMVPAHHVMRLELVGCPDPNPQLDRFFDPQPQQLPADIDAIGKAYVEALACEMNLWLDSIDSSDPLGVLFSGGIDSGCVLLSLYHQLLARGESPARLKAFTLTVDGAQEDASQAEEFLRALKLEMLLEVVDVPAKSIDWKKAVGVVEDYKPLDIQAASVGLALCEAIRERYSDWTWLVDGDGGDENLKDYPIEDNPELTIRSVLNNQMLYQEGWGVSAIKHSLVYSGGQSRGHVRTFAPASSLGFRGFSPFALPRVIAVAEGIPFIDLTEWSHEKLYDLKGQVVKAGIRHLMGVEMPVYEKRRFQIGATGAKNFARLFPTDEQSYRDEFLRQYVSQNTGA